MTDAQKDVMTIVQYMLGKDENPTEEKIKEEVDKCSVLIPDMSMIMIKTFTAGLSRHGIEIKRA